MEDAQKSAVYLNSPVIVVPPTCTDGPRIKAGIINHAAKSSPSLIVQAKAGDTIKAQTAAAFPLEKGGHKEVLLTPTGAHDPAPTLQVVITDWTTSLGASVDHHAITVATTRSCTLGVEVSRPTPPTAPAQRRTAN